MLLLLRRNLEGEVRVNAPSYDIGSDVSGHGVAVDMAMGGKGYGWKDMGGRIWVEGYGWKGYGMLRQ